MSYVIGVCDATPIGTDKRLNPGLAMPGARSIIVVGKSYEPSPYNNLSSLAYGVDYHLSVRALLEDIAATLDCNKLIMVDNGPLQEKPFAVKAGLGFLAKSGLVISPLLGSRFNIGLMLVDIDLPSTPAKEMPTCPDDCRLCLDACPSATCISYLTQKRGKLSEEEQAAIAASGQLYGCDICQDCCPFNSQVQDRADYRLLNIDKDTFNKKFGHTAMAWRGLEHLKRNAGYLIGKKRG